jgi:hypothetical protein
MVFRITLPRPMRVFRSCPGNFGVMEKTGGCRAKGEIVEVGEMVIKTYDHREKLAIPLMRHNEGQFLLVEELDHRTRELGGKWTNEYSGRYIEDPDARERAHLKEKEIRQHLEMLLRMHGANPHLRLVKAE